jgi:hypothetical protein
LPRLSIKRHSLRQVPGSLRHHLRTARTQLPRAQRNLTFRVQYGHTVTSEATENNKNSLILSQAQMSTTPRFAPTVSTTLGQGTLSSIAARLETNVDMQVQTLSTFFAKKAIIPQGNFSQAYKRQLRRAIARLQHRRRELRYYRKYPRLRLAKTKVTRRRRRKANLGLFARRSLKRPKTLLGVKNFLLPPAVIYRSAFQQLQAGVSFKRASLRALTILPTSVPRT